MVLVFLVLAAQYESWTSPAAVISVVPLSAIGVIVAVTLARADLNVYSQIGLVLLIALASKNAILIVEFANQLRERGRDLVSATMEAARFRFRPILMTALATMMGILPIAAGLGAGGESRAPLGVAVVSGMLFSTFLTFFIVPATYITIERLRARVMGSERGLPAVPDPALLESDL